MQSDKLLPHRAHLYDVIIIIIIILSLIYSLAFYPQEFIN